MQNVYTQHTPPLLRLLENAAKCRLGSEFPESDGSVPDASSQLTVRPPRLIMVFIVGGTTYEESKAVAELNASTEKGEGWSSGIQFLLAGTGVQNSSSFLEDWAAVARDERHTLRDGMSHHHPRLNGSSVR